MRSILRNMAVLAGALALAACVGGGSGGGKAKAPNPITGGEIEVTALEAPPAAKPAAPSAAEAPAADRPAAPKARPAPDPPSAGASRPPGRALASRGSGLPSSPVEPVRTGGGEAVPRLLPPDPTVIIAA